MAQGFGISGPCSAVHSLWEHRVSAGHGGRVTVGVQGSELHIVF